MCFSVNRDRGVPAGVPAGQPGQPGAGAGALDAAGLGAIANSPQLARLREVSPKHPVLDRAHGMSRLSSKTLPFSSHYCNNSPHSILSSRR
jgi:hypothetical protein